MVCWLCVVVAAAVLLVISTLLLLCCCCYKEKSSSLFKGNGFHSLRTYEDDYSFNSKAALLQNTYKDEEETDSDFDVFDRPKFNGHAYKPIK